MTTTMIAALFVDAAGCYAGVPGVELWCERRDARTYRGPHPVVAHPPCARWCNLAALVEARYGYKRGDDGGCFEQALRAVVSYGGVLEHPAGSAAWRHYGLPIPRIGDGWVHDDLGASCAVEQGAYGHPARKRTWLYAVGTATPALHWRMTGAPRALVGFCANKRIAAGDTRLRLNQREGAMTPPAFRDVLVSLARSVR